MKQHRWPFVVVVAVLAVILVMWAPAQVQEQVPDVIRAKRFQLVDDLGQLRAELHLGDIDGSGNLRLYDAEGRIRVKVGTSVDGSTGLLLLNDDIEPAVEVFVSKAEGVRVELFGEDGTTRIIRPWAPMPSLRTPDSSWP